MPINTLICTVGTSLFYPNIAYLPDTAGYAAWVAKQPATDRPYLTRERIQELARAYQARDSAAMARVLAALPGTTRMCGAEINSITDLISHAYCASPSNLHFCASQTGDGQLIAEVLRHYYTLQGMPARVETIADLQDEDPKRFRTKGLRNLAKTVCRIIRDYGAPWCAINATGGYKAQIAIGVLMGQALGVPVYYKHERFSEIIAFPPMPISLDHQLWMEHSGLFAALNRHEVLSRDQLVDDGARDWDERLETLVEYVDIDGIRHLELSPTGQIFYETFAGQFASERDQFLPPAVPTARKQPPSLEDHNWGNARDAIRAFMQRLTDECGYVRGCRTHYWNPALSRATLFRLWGDKVEGVFSNRTWTVKIVVDTLATTTGQRAAVVADLNARLGEWGY